MVEASRAACFALALVRCTVCLPAEGTTPFVLFMVLFKVHDISVASLLPGRSPVSEIFVRAASKAAPADIA